jgi:hypothetical protein
MLEAGACEALESYVIKAIKLKCFSMYSQLKVIRGRDISEVPDLYLIFGYEVQRDTLWDKVQRVICRQQEGGMQVGEGYDLQNVGLALF